MTQSDKQFWFPAKKYGWGWGLPSAWQGCVVLVVYAFLVFLEINLTKQPISIILVATTTVFLVLICRLKGEQPQWRWGGDE